MSVRNEIKLPFEFHILDGEFIQRAVAGADEDVAVGQLPQGRHALAEEFVEGSESFEEGAFNGDFEDVAGGGSAVGILVVLVDDGAGELPLDVAEVHVQAFDLSEKATFLLALSTVMI